MMSRPRVCDCRPLTTIASYLVRRPRLTLLYNWQRRQSQIDGYTDSDWAGCASTRKSTGRDYSRQQKTIALSAAEAELYGMTACSWELLGMQACADDLGINVNVAVYAVTSAALDIV